MAQRCRSSYRGKRYSLGYPLVRTWKIRLEYGNCCGRMIGAHLTEGFMMDPEASVGALVYQHPNCTYFSVGEADEA